MITKHELWEKLIFSSNGALYNQNLATRARDRFADEAEYLDDGTRNSLTSHHVLTKILTSEAERVVRTVLDPSDGSHTHGFEAWLTGELEDIIASVPDPLLEETEQLVYDELDNPEELPVEWSVPSVVRKV